MFLKSLVVTSPIDSLAIESSFIPKNFSHLAVIDESKQICTDRARESAEIFCKRTHQMSMIPAISFYLQGLDKVIDSHFDPVQIEALMCSEQDIEQIIWNLE